MPTIQLTSEVSINELVNGVESLSTPDLEDLVTKVLAIQAKRRAPSLPKNEAELLQKINQGLSPKDQQRFDELNEKRRDETLTSDEHQELLQFIDCIEASDVQRIKYLGQLAHIRGVSIRDLMQELQLHPADHG